MSSPEPKRIKFTDDNIEYYERQFKLEHDIAMGYVPRPTPRTPPVPSIMELAMEVFRPPPSIQPIMETFRAWINRNRMARFDCFQEPGWNCSCYKCVTWCANREADVTMMERIMDERNRDAILGSPNSPDAKDGVEEEKATNPDDENALFSVRYASVCHFYSELPYDDDDTPLTPKFSTVEYDLPASDHGKQKAQEKWIALMQMTPTRLIF